MDIHQISQKLPINLRRSKLIFDDDEKTTIMLHLAGAIKNDCRSGEKETNYLLESMIVKILFN